MTPYYMTAFSHTVLITPDKKPTQALLNLLATCNIQHDGSLSAIIEATQKEQPFGFIRPKNKERWQITPYLTDKKEAIYTHCKDLSMMDEIKPLHYDYDYIVLFGGTLEGMRTRLSFFLRLWQEGVRGKQIIILTGHRFLDPVIESKALIEDRNNGLVPIKETWQLTNDPKTETDMIKIIFEQGELPQEWTTLPIIIVDTPAPQGSTRPNTADTIHHWLTFNPIPGSLLAIAEQPSIGYQDAVLQRYLPSFTIETVGPSIPTHRITPEVLVGTVGWWLYNAQFLL